MQRINEEIEILNEQKRSEPKALQSFLVVPERKKKSTGDPRSLRDSVLNDAMSFMGWDLKNKRQLGQMLKGFKGKKPSEIYRCISTAKQEGKNPKAYFRYLMGMCKRVDKST